MTRADATPGFLAQVGKPREGDDDAMANATSGDCSPGYSSRAPIAKEFYESVLRPAWQRLADLFATMMNEGRLKFADPWTTAMHWKGLTEWDLLEQHLLSAEGAGNPNDIVTAATAAADAFLQVYASPRSKITD